MNILVTGGAGYLGSVLLPKLIARGHSVSVLDVGYFGVSHIRSLYKPVSLIREDIRRIYKDSDFLKNLLSGCDCVIHLAAISNDPSAELSPKLTEDINYNATKTLAEACKERKIKFVFSSSCSVYGNVSEEVDEEYSLKPLTVYAATKAKAEEMLYRLADKDWKPVILRNGTLFGYSPRMRFDLVVNIFSLYSTLYNEIKVFGQGQEWRPYLHVKDCARAFVYFAERYQLKNICYNIATENLRIIDVASYFRELNPQLRISHVNVDNEDKRNYRVSTGRMKEEGFYPELKVKYGAEELVDAIASGLIQDPDSIYYRNVKWFKELVDIGNKDQKEIIILMETLARLREKTGF